MFLRVTGSSEPNQRKVIFIVEIPPIQRWSYRRAYTPTPLPRGPLSAASGVGLADYPSATVCDVLPNILDLLHGGVVEPELAGQGRAVDLVPLGVGLGCLPERGADILQVRNLSERLQGQESRPPARSLLDFRDGDGPAKGVGHNLAPCRGVQQPAAGRDNVTLAGDDRVDDLGNQSEPQ